MTEFAPNYWYILSNLAMNIHFKIIQAAKFRFFAIQHDIKLNNSAYLREFTLV